MSNAAQGESKTAAISSVAELSEEAMALARPKLHPREYVALLLEKALFEGRRAIRGACAAEAGSSLVGMGVRAPRVGRESSGENRSGLAGDREVDRATERGQSPRG